MLAALVGSSVFDRVKPFGFQDPASDSSRVNEILEDSTGERPFPDVVLLVEPRPGEPLGAASRRAARELAAVDEVSAVRTAASTTELRSRDRRAALVLGSVDAGVESIADVGERVQQRFAGDPEVTAGGAAVTARQLNETTEDDLRRIELVAAPLLLLLSFFIFRGLVAAMLPLVVGALSILTTLALLRLLTDVMEIDVYVINIVTGLGLGLAIDYSLFVISRFRDELEAGAEVAAAVERTVGSMGRMVLFSGLTVAAALIALTVFPQRFLYSIGVGSAIVAIISALVSLTVLPALLGLLGHRVNALSPARLGPRRKPSRRWHKLGRLVLDRPLVVALAVAALMVAAGLPFLRVELTRADASVLPAESSAHRVDSALKSRFAVDPSSQVTILIEDGGGASKLAAARRALRDEKGVLGVGAPARIDSEWRRLDTELSVDPFSDAAVDAVERARSLDWGAPALVGGAAAELRDQRASLAEHLPLALAVIVVSSFLLLLLLTRSVVLPLVSLAMNALTISVAFGILVLIFQDGRAEGLLDYMGQAALDLSIPILLFAVTFGLSTDYGIFLLQRISEARATAGSEDEAIAAGLEKSGRLITAAALLFAVAMGAFALSDLVYIKEVAIGTAVAVLVDATIVRALLLPAVLSLLGSRAWWGPKRWQRRAAPA